jgi:hypothetical protein
METEYFVYKARQFWNVVLEKDGEDQLDWACEKLRSIT